jgi:lactose/L-arabinose transport system ATP-binding protein
VVAAGVRLPASGKVTVGLRPQHLRVIEGATHRVDMTEALGGVSYIHLTAPTGEKLVIEAKGDVTPAAGSMAGIAFDASDALFFDEVSGLRLR